MDSKVTYKVSLSNGETFYENKGIMKSEPGEVSSLRKLYNYIDENNLAITSVALVCNGVEHNLPSSGNQARFKAFSDAYKPKDYKIYRKVGTTLQGGSHEVTEHFTVARAIYDGYYVELWVNNNAPYNSYVLVSGD